MISPPGTEYPLLCLIAFRNCTEVLQRDSSSQPCRNTLLGKHVWFVKSRKCFRTRTLPAKRWNGKIVRCKKIFSALQELEKGYGKFFPLLTMHTWYGFLFITEMSTALSQSPFAVLCDRTLPLVGESCRIWYHISMAMTSRAPSYNKITRLFCSGLSIGRTT